MVSPSEGNEARREGRQGVAVPHSSVEAGERALPDPVERRGHRIVGPEAGTTPRASNLPACHRQADGSCEGQRSRNVTSRMRLRRARPDLWELWGSNPPERPGLRNLSPEPCGWKARPVESDQRLEASPAWGVGNPHREAWTASPKAMLWSAERPFVGAFAVRIPGATLRHRHGLVTAVPPASTEHVRTDNRGSPGTCEILSSPPRAPGRETGSTTPGLGGALVRRGAKERVDAEVPPNEGNEVRRDGRQEVIAP